MSAAYLCTEFEKLVDSPEAVRLVREFTLDLAVRGKLVAQDSRDEPAGLLLERLRAAASGQPLARRRTATPLQPIREDEMPFPLPQTWVWVRLPELAPYIQRGKSPEYV